MEKLRAHRIQTSLPLSPPKQICRNRTTSILIKRNREKRKNAIR
jgi:hypothetical protein